MQAYRFVFTFFLLALGGDLAFSNQLNQPYEEGIRYKNVGQYQKAIASFEKVLKDAEADIDKSLLAETYYQIASTNHILEDYDEAISSYKKAIVLNPNSVLYYNAIGISYSELKKYKEAIAAYEKAIELTPKNAQPYYNMGLVYLKQGHFALAKDAFYKAINADKDWGEPFIGLGEILLKQGHLEGAERAYLVAEHFSPNGINILLGLGKVYARQKRFELAIEKVKKVIDIQMDNTEAHYQLSQLYHKLGDRGKASSEMTLFKLLRKTDPILEDAKKWVKRNPDDPRGYNNLGIIYLTRLRYDKAVEYYKRAISLSPNLAITHYNLGHTYHKQGELDLAINAYQKAISLDSSLAIAHNNLAVCYSEMRQNLEEAFVHATAATGLVPDDSNYWDTLATICSLLGLNTQAQEARQKQKSLLNSHEK